MTPAWTGAIAPLAKAGEAGKAGPIGLAVILLLCIVCYFLFKSMSKHMRKVRENFPTGKFPEQERSDAGTDHKRAGGSEAPGEAPAEHDGQRRSERPGSADS